MVELAGKPETPILQTSLSDEGSVVALFDGIDKALGKSPLNPSQDSKSTLFDLIFAQVEPELHQWVEKQSPAAPNPYEFMIRFVKKHPPGTLLPS